MNTVHAIFENGVFRPLGTVDLPEHAEVEFEPRPLLPAEVLKAANARVWEVLSERYRSGEHDVAERHDEHQP
jgi:predicted DNA-binding antitoxin AbrB/MazE fold protein